MCYNLREVRNSKIIRDFTFKDGIDKRLTYKINMGSIVYDNFYVIKQYIIKSIFFLL